MLGTFVEGAGEHHRAALETQVADQEAQGNTDGSPLGAIVVGVNVGDSEAGARLVGCPCGTCQSQPCLSAAQEAYMSL